MLTQGEIPAYYTEDDIKTDPRNLYFDLETGNFQYYQAMLMRNNPTWVAVTDCFKIEKINPFEIAKEKMVEGEDLFELARQYSDNLNTLRNILEKHYPVQTVPAEAHIDDAIDVFDRVNSLGTKLSDADLALTHITGKWPKARQVMKDKIRELSDQRFSFNLTFMVRCLVGVVNGRALFETIHETPEPELEDGWTKLSKILDYLVTILPSHANIHSTEDLNTTNVLVPAVVYLSKHGTKFGGQDEMRRFIHWMYAASVWARYTSQTDQRLDHDISIIQRSESPWKELVDSIIEQRGRIEVKPSDLEGRITQHPLYRMTYIMAKSRGAVDWFNGSPLATTHGAAYAIHSHHIFPTSILYSQGDYDSENHLHKKIVNEIANRAFLTSDSNIGLGNTEPAVYLPQIEEKYPGSLAKQFVPMDSNLWQLDRYEDFLSARRKLIAATINEQMEGLLAELEEPRAITLEEMLAAGESPVLEFKASMRWDYRAQRVNTELHKVIAKAIAGMMNSEGGSLLIGVMDDGSIVGIENDYETLQRKDRDCFEQTLRQIISNYLGDEFSQYAKVLFFDQESRTVCHLITDSSPKPVYLDDKGEKEFYIRAGNTTRPLDVQGAHDYISMHWEA